MKSLVITFGAILSIIMLPLLFIGLYDARSEQLTQTFSGVSTAAGVYSANITLSKAPWGDDIEGVVEISSNVTSDAPSASAYNEVSKLLTVSGLEQSDTRTLSVVYDISSTVLSGLYGIDTFLALFAWFIVFLIFGLICGAVYAFFRS